MVSDQPHGSAAIPTSNCEESTCEELHSTYQLAGIVLRVRDDLDIQVRHYGGEPTYIVQDGLTSRFYRIGSAEYTFLSLLDGSTTFAAALGKTAALMKEDALTEQRAASFCKWLVQNNLASTQHSRLVQRLVKKDDESKEQEVHGKFSVLSQRLALFHPKTLVDAGNRALGWLFSAPVFALWIALIAVGLTTAVVQWDNLTANASSVISRNNWIWLFATWLVLKVVHESAHAIACRRFGGNVREAGIMFIVFLPLPYVDVTSAWRFASKWQRIITSSAGMMAELAIASVALIVWSRTEPGLLNQNALNVVFSAGLVTLLFNANPLMRFDGYYILIDWLELPNLYTHGHQAIRQIGRRWGLGLSASRYDYPEGRRWTILAYGAASFVWRIVICVGLVLAADAMFFGLGTILALIAMVTWALLPVIGILKFVATGNELEKPSRIRFAGLVLGGAGLMLAIAFFVPWYGSASAPLVVDYYPQADVRSGVTGFVDKVLVKSGQQVKEGQLLFVLRSDELNTQLAEIQLDIEVSRQRAVGYLNDEQVAAYQVECETITALQKRLGELNHQKRASTVRAPVDGIVLSSDLDKLAGAYITLGQPLVAIGGLADKKLLALVDQSQSDVFRSRVGQDVKVHVDGVGTSWHVSELTEVAMKATRQVPHPALTATCGGPLDVRAQQLDRGPETARHEELNFELVAPHFLARASVPKDMGMQLFAGQSGTLTFFTNDGSIANHLGRLAGNWWNKRQQAIQKQLHLR